MIKIEDYMLLSIQERKSHLRLNEDCIERGGGTDCSVYSRALLAHILNTTIQFNKRTKGGLKVYACHACNNNRCSNPYHLYWGTPIENNLDAKANGNRSVWENTVVKYGLEKAREFSKLHGGIRRKEAILEINYSDARKIPERTSAFDTVWITRSGIEMRIKSYLLNKLLSEGWQRGRLESSKDFKPKVNKEQESQKEKYVCTEEHKKNMSISSKEAWKRRKLVNTDYESSTSNNRIAQQDRALVS